MEENTGLPLLARKLTEPSSEYLLREEGRNLPECVQGTLPAVAFARYPLNKLLAHYGARINSICYYEMMSGPETYYFMSWRTPAGQVGDFRSSME